MFFNELKFLYGAEIQKGGQCDDRKKQQQKSVKVVKTVLEAVLKIDANTASSWIAYQPEMPSEIKKFKKVR